MSNLGKTRLKKTRPGRNKMREFDALPPALRSWMAEAALPWSAKSCLKIWRNATSQDEALRRLQAAEMRLLQRERGIS